MTSLINYDSSEGEQWGRYMISSRVPKCILPETYPIPAAEILASQTSKSVDEEVY